MHDWLVALGIILLLIGVVATLYQETETFFSVEIPRGYPYRDLGLVLVLGGIICIALGAVHSPQKEKIAKQTQNRFWQSAVTPSLDQLLL